LDFSFPFFFFFFFSFSIATLSNFYFLLFFLFPVFWFNADLTEKVLGLMYENPDLASEASAEDWGYLLLYWAWMEAYHKRDLKQKISKQEMLEVLRYSISLSTSI